MDYKEAIEILQTLYPLRCRMVDGRLKGGFRDYGCDEGQAIAFAVSAMRKLEMYKVGKLVLIPDATYKKQCEELNEYKKLGTLKEVRKAVEKQKAEKPEIEEIFRNGIDIYGNIYGETAEVYKCPSCDSFISFVVDNQHIDYCAGCGQKLDWSEVEE